jgi:perosamine synthetase
MLDREWIPWAQPSFWGSEQAYVAEALASTWISGGAFVERFERDFAVRHGAPYAATAASGTAALHMGYLALGLGPGDEVIVPGFGFLAAAHMAMHVRAVPVFAEVDPETWCLSPAAVEAALSPRTKAIVPVHTYGNLCDLDGIGALAAGRGVPIVEDAAEALGSRQRGRLAGTTGALGSFSFHATKTITTGEGGMVVTHDRGLYERMCLHRSHGMLRKRHYWHELPGHNFRLTNLQAALGCAQLERLEAILDARHRVQAEYRRRLAGVAGVTLQRFAPEVEPVVWTVALRLDPAAFPQGRDAVMGQMRERGIETRNGFVAPSLMPGYGCGPLPVCEALSREVLSLPTSPTLTTVQIDRICAVLTSLRA